MAANGASQNKISQHVGRSRGLVKHLLAEPEIQRAVVDEKAELARIYREKARAIVTSIDAVDISKASLQQKAISSGILLDKSLLLVGEATSVDVHVLVDAAKAYRDMRRAERLKELSAPPVVQSAPPAKDSRQLASQDEPTVRYYPVPLEAPSENG
jgi:hypothetical protein